jgi:hypothetical protein
MIDYGFEHSAASFVPVFQMFIAAAQFLIFPLPGRTPTLAEHQSVSRKAHEFEHPRSRDLTDPPAPFH